MDNALVRSLAVVTLVLVVHGCVNPNADFWLTDEDLNKYRQRGCIEVSSPSGLYSGLLEKVPTNVWKTVTLQRMQYRIEVPETLPVSDVPDWNGISFYVIHSRYPDPRHAAQVIVERKTKQLYDEDVDRQRRITKELLAEGRINKTQAVFEEWRYVTFHPTLDVDKDGTLYRRDIRCPNGDVLEIEGMVRMLTERKTGRPLYPEMDAVIRRIINSIEPLNVTTNK